jgi:hypothetical protein
MSKKCRECGVVLNKKNCFPSKLINRNYICKECSKINARNEKRSLKLEIITAYGEECACCGENQAEFLTIDHISGDGARHRKQIGSARKRASSDTLYRWLKKNGFPKDNFQLLCFNCNCAKSSSGSCPHQQQKK